MKLRIAPFCMDITPPVGAPLAYVPNDKIDSPIYVRGLVLDDGGKRIVWVAADIISYWGSAYHTTREIIAKAAGTSPGRVFLHVVHQHDSMYFAPQFNPYYERFNEICIPPAYYQDVNRRLRETVAQAVQNSGGSWESVENIATAETRAAGLASNRRIMNDKGLCIAMRYSRCRDEELKKLPTGLIDPILRTLAFKGSGGRTLAALHFYASHPMGDYKRNQVGSDVPGVALETVSKLNDPETFHIYLTGCAGNITFGKYYLNGEKTIKALGERMGRYMAENMQSLKTQEISPLQIATESFTIPFASDINEETMEALLSKSSDLAEAGYAIRRLIIARNRDAWSKVHVTRVTLGPYVHMMSLPSESMVEYQIYAQNLVPEHFLAVAAYNNLTYGYIPTAAMFDEGGYEPERGSVCTKEVEKPYRNAIASALSEIIHTNS